AGAGMSHAGRITFHEMRYLGDPNSTLLLVGYQVPGTLGRQLQEGLKTVEIFGNTVDVRARIETLFTYSAHRDSSGLLEFISSGASSLEKVFVAMGEPKASAFLAQRVKDYLGLSATVPQEGETFELKFGR